MFRKVWKVCFILTVVLAAGGAFGIEAPLEYQTSGDTPGFQPYGSVSIMLKAEAPEGDWKFPEWKSERPQFGTLKLGDKDRMIVLDKKKKGDDSYNRLYFDANANRDLTDDDFIGTRAGPRVSGGTLRIISFPPVDTTVEVDGKSLPYRFEIMIYDLLSGASKGLLANQVQQRIQVIVQTRCSYTSEFEVKGTKYRFILGDQDCDGRFGSKGLADSIMKTPDGTEYYRGDQLFITTDFKRPDFDACMPLGNLLYLKDRLFETRIDPAGNKMVMTPVESGLSPLNLSGNDVQRLCLYSKDKKRFVNIFKPGDTVQLPAGEYKILDYKITRKDKAGDDWFIIARGSAESPFVAVGEGRDAALKFGEPFKPFVYITDGECEQVAKGRSNQVMLQFAVEGAGGERLANLQKTSGVQYSSPGLLSKIFGGGGQDKADSGIVMSKRNPTLPREPTFKVATPKGKIVTAGSFEYG